MNSCKVTLLGFTILRWVSKLIRKRHESSVTNVAWHTNNILLATTSTDGKCRVFSTFIKGVDTKDSKAGSPAESKFGEVLFISEKMVISVGYDSNPMVFAADDTGICLFLNFSSNIRNLSLSVLFCLTRVFIVLCFQFSEAFTKFYGQSKATTANEASESSKSRGSVHDNCINSIVSLSKAGSPQVMRFSTSGLDGKIAIWDLGNMQEELGHQF
uniref:Arp2/3 complex 41 kDa subunit n=1 Tax=Brassica campestris TaxID=3711 RepID=M4DYT0_BRACM